MDCSWNLQKPIELSGNYVHSAILSNPMHSLWRCTLIFIKIRFCRILHYHLIMIYLILILKYFNILIFAHQFVKAKAEDIVLHIGLSGRTAGSKGNGTGLDQYANWSSKHISLLDFAYNLFLAESIHCLSLSVTHLLHHSLIFLSLEWCDFDCWRYQIKYWGTAKPTESSLSDWFGKPYAAPESVVILEMFLFLAGCTL